MLDLIFVYTCNIKKKRQKLKNGVILNLNLVTYAVACFLQWIKNHNEPNVLSLNCTSNTVVDLQCHDCLCGDNYCSDNQGTYVITSQSNLVF